MTKFDPVTIDFPGSYYTIEPVCFDVQDGCLVALTGDDMDDAPHACAVYLMPGADGDGCHIGDVPDIDTGRILAAGHYLATRRDLLGYLFEAVDRYHEDRLEIVEDDRTPEGEEDGLLSERLHGDVKCILRTVARTKLEVPA